MFSNLTLKLYLIGLASLQVACASDVIIESENSDNPSTTLTTPSTTSANVTTSATDPCVDENGFPGNIICPEDIPMGCDEGGVDISRDEDVCDGEDNDCDGNVDEGLLNQCGVCGELVGVPGAQCGVCGTLDCNADGELKCDDPGEQIFYNDSDGDGFGNSEFLEMCQPEGNFSALFGDDCNDDDDTIFPGAAETCDNIDTDCLDNETEFCPLIKLASEDYLAWETVPELDFSDPEAPTELIRAAFDSWTPGGVGLLTDTKAHFYDLDTYTWLPSIDLNILVPEVIADGTQIRSAYATTGLNFRFRPTVFISTQTHTYAYKSDSFSLNENLMFTYAGKEAYPTETSEFAPRQSEVLTEWLQQNTTPDWYSVTPAEVCGEGDQLGLHTISLTDTMAYLFDNTYCGSYILAIPVAEFYPFTLSNGPQTSNIAGTYWYNGLHVIKNTFDVSP